MSYWWSIRACLTKPLIDWRLIETLIRRLWCCWLIIALVHRRLIVSLICGRCSSRITTSSAIARLKVGVWLYVIRQLTGYLRHLIEPRVWTAWKWRRRRRLLWWIALITWLSWITWLTARITWLRSWIACLGRITRLCSSSWIASLWTRRIASLWIHWLRVKRVETEWRYIWVALSGRIRCRIGISIRIWLCWIA